MYRVLPHHLRLVLDRGDHSRHLLKLPLASALKYPGLTVMLALLIVVLWAKLADFRLPIFIHWSIHFVARQHQGLQSLSSFPVFVARGVMDVAVLVLKGGFSPTLRVNLLKSICMMLVEDCGLLIFSVQAFWWGIIMFFDNSIIRALIINIHLLTLLVLGSLIFCSIFRHTSGVPSECTLVMERYLSISLVILRRLLRLLVEVLRHKLTEAVSLRAEWHHSLGSKRHAYHVRVRHHSHGVHAVRPVNHAAGYSLLLLEVCLFLRSSGELDHLFEVDEAAKSVSMGLSLHVCHSGFVMSCLTVDWAISNHHMLSLVALEAFQVLLIMQLLELVETQMLLM